jgi:nicotinate phosphoribosyltransferase
MPSADALSASASASASPTFSPALLTDRYQLTMLAAYAREGLAERPAVFELFARRLPPQRRYLVAAGLGRALPLLQGLRFTDDDLAWLSADPILGPALRQASVRKVFEEFRFRAKVWAVPEGRICFPGEPLVRVEGTLAEGQLVETLLLSIVNHDVRVASKCARIVQAADGRPCLEFGSRRTHEVAAVAAARTAYLAGFASTSNEAAARLYGIPVAGTMAHAYLLAHAADEGEDGETTAFSAFANTFEAPTTSLVDTFDTPRGIRRAATAVGARLAGIRIDSGDLGALAHEARGILDEAGLPGAKVVVSDDLDEGKIASLLAMGAPIDAFGVGTMAVSPPDHPSLGAVYKLVAMADRSGALTAVQKRAGGKGSHAAPKQVFRAEGTLTDVVGLVTEQPPSGCVPLLELVLDDRVRIDPPPTALAELTAARARLVADRAAASQTSSPLLSLAPRADSEGFPVTPTKALQETQATVESDGRAVVRRHQSQ